MSQAGNKQCPLAVTKKGMAQHSLRVGKKGNEKFTLFGNYNGSLLRRQPGASLIVLWLCRQLGQSSHRRGSKLGSNGLVSTRLPSKLRARAMSSEYKRRTAPTRATYPETTCCKKPLNKQRQGTFQR